MQRPPQLTEHQQEYFLELINFLLYKLSDTHSPVSEADELRDLLESGGSAWTVRQRATVYRLERRVSAPVSAAAERAMSTPGSAGKLLESAWSATYGRNPNPGEAYDDAIKAVEAAGVGVVSPNNMKATLGTMVRDMKNAPSKWTFTLTTAPHVDATAMVISMMETLWTGQAGRHGAAGPVHVENSQSETEAALLLAVPLVQWFGTGAIKGL